MKLGSVNVSVSKDVLEVQWLKPLYDREGNVVQELPHRCAYDQSQKDQFVADIESPANGGSPGMAAPYIVAVGW